MTVPPDDHRPAPRLRPVRRRPVAGAVLLLVLLALPIVAALLPVDPGAVRAGGLALAWWYAGLLAPLVGLGIAAWAVPGAGPAGAPRQRR
jgi:hypothetical protein